MKLPSFWLVAVALMGIVTQAPGQEPQPPAGPGPIAAKAPHALQLGWAPHSWRAYTTGSFCSLSAWDFTTREGQSIIDCRVAHHLRLPNHANSMAVGQKSSSVVTGENSGVVGIRDGRTFEVLHQLEVGAPYSIYAVAISADEQQVAACGTDGSVCLWDLKDSAKLHRLAKAGREGERLSALGFSPDGKALASLSRYGRLVLWDTMTHQPSGQVDVAAGEDAALSFSKKGDRVLAVYRMNVVSWHPEHEPQPKTFVAPESVAPRYPKNVGASRPAFSGPMGEAIRFAGVATLTSAGYVACIRENGGIAVWDPATGRVLATLAPPTEATSWEHPGTRFECIRCSPDGRLLAATTAAGELFVWNAPDSSVVKR